MPEYALFNVTCFFCIIRVLSVLCLSLQWVQFNILVWSNISLMLIAVCWLLVMFGIICKRIAQIFCKWRFNLRGSVVLVCPIYEFNIDYWLLILRMQPPKEDENLWTTLFLTKEDFWGSAWLVIMKTCFNLFIVNEKFNPFTGIKLCTGEVYFSCFFHLIGCIWLW